MSRLFAEKRIETDLPDVPVSKTTMLSDFQTRNWDTCVNINLTDHRGVAYSVRYNQTVHKNQLIRAGLFLQGIPVRFEISWEELHGLYIVIIMICLQNAKKATLHLETGLCGAPDTTDWTLIAIIGKHYPHVPNNNLEMRLLPAI